MFLVFDTSVFIAAFLTPHGLAAELLHRRRRNAFIICSSRAILDELREKLREKEVTEVEIGTFLRLILPNTVLCDDRRYSTKELEQDDHIVGCFRACQADMVVTLDRKLLKRLKQLEIPAVHPRNFSYYFPTSN